MSQYTEEIREIERRLELAATASATIPEIDMPPGIPESFDEHIRLHFDMTALAFRADITRVATLLGARDLTARSYVFPKSDLFPNGGVSGGFHGASHHQEDPVQIRRYADINRYHVSTLAYLAEKLRAIPDGDGTLLDHSLIMYGSNMGNSNQHMHYDVPHILVGGANGQLTGQPASRVRAQDGDDRQPPAERARPVRRPQGRAGRQHRPAREARIGRRCAHTSTTRRDPASLSPWWRCSSPRCRAAADRSDVADAAMKGDRAALRTLVQQKADVNAPQIDGATALHWAVYHDDRDAADLLIKAGAKVDAANREGVTPLAMASLYGSAAMVDRLLNAGADARQHGSNGETMLMFAARNGNPAVIKRLVAAGVDVNAKEPLRGTTALMWAVEQRHPAAVKMLLEVGADHAAKTGPAGLPRNYMAPRVNTAAVKEAARRYAAAAAAGRTYRRAARVRSVAGHEDLDGVPRRAQRRRSADRENRAAAPVRLLPDSGPPRPAPAPVAPPPAPAPPAGDDDAEVIIAGLVGSGGGGLTPLTFAAREGDLESAQYLLDAGADINQTTEYGWTPLLTATNNRHYQLGAFLMSRGANANLANKGGWTPLYLATDNRNIEGGDYPVRKPDMDHLEYIAHAAGPWRRPEPPRERQHADAHDFHDAVVLRGGLHAVRPRRAVERHRADAAAPRLRRRSVPDDRQRRYGTHRRGRHRLGRRRHVRAIREGERRGDPHAARPRARSERRRPAKGVRR